MDNVRERVDKKRTNLHIWFLIGEVCCGGAGLSDDDSLSDVF